MNRDHLFGRLKQFNGKLQEQWCSLHNDQVGVVAAKRIQIAGRAQAQCGMVRQESARQLGAFQNTYRNWRLTAETLPMQLLQHQKPTQQNRASYPGLTTVKS